MEQKQVLILLATYKGNLYVREMINSVLAQDFDDYGIILSDDGEDTCDILEEYANKYPDKIIHYRSGQRFGSAQKHFMHLLNTFADKAPYFMFCDQDDVWHTDKVRKTLEVMKQTEENASIPTMVHTDLNVVDANLNLISPSFIKYSGLDGNRLQFNKLLVQNTVTGCTMMVNKALALLSKRDLPENAMLMHDWWLALIASAFGKCGFLNEPTIYYRQHGNNTVGAKNSRSPSYIIAKMKSGIKTAMSDTAKQAETFAFVYKDMLNPKQLEILAALSACFKKGKLNRILTYSKYGLWKIKLRRIIGQIIWG